MILSGFSVYNGLAPKHGPKALRYNADFSTTLSVDFDLTKEQDGLQIEFVQAVWVDNRLNIRPLTIDVIGVPFQIPIPAFAIGMFPIVHSGHFRATISVPLVVASAIPMVFLNVPQPYFVYTPGA